MYFNAHNINPYIRTALQSVFTKGTKIKRRVIFDYELIYIERGEFVLSYNECDYKCNEGQFLLLRPGVPHSFSGINRELSQPHIHFDIVYRKESPQIPISFKDISEFTPEELRLIHKDIFEDYPQIPFINFENKEKALKMFFEIINEPKSSLLIQKSRLIQIIDMLITDNFSNCFSAETEKYGVAQQLKDYIDAGYGMASTLTDFEKQFSYSKYYLERQFKKNYGISLIAYRNNKRLQLAEKLLKTNTVSYVSEKLGFTSIYVFSRAFKQYFGYSPTMHKIKEKAQ